MGEKGGVVGGKIILQVARHDELLEFGISLV